MTPSFFGTVIGQYPDVFSAAVICNPVTSCGEISTSDIPDWYFVEFGFPYDSTTIMTPSIYAALFAASPISHVDKVCANVLLLLGEADLRVAPTQSLTYYHALKGRGKAVEMLAFPKESHLLNGVETSKICWEATRDWFDAARNQLVV
jgi:dipeptidyl aminopeptidase/acylaminoacyl peptidase